MASRMIQRQIAAVGLCFSMSAIAGPTSEWNYIGSFEQAAPSSVFANAQFNNASGLSSAADTSSRAFTLDAQNATDSSASASSVSATADIASTLGTPSSLQLTLWSFVSLVSAQQTGDAFQTVASTEDLIAYTLEGVTPPAPVPLAPSWVFFIAGTACLAWMRRRHSAH